MTSEPRQKTTRQALFLYVGNVISFDQSVRTVVLSNSGKINQPFGIGSDITVSIGCTPEETSFTVTDATGDFKDGTEFPSETQENLDLFSVIQNGDSLSVGCANSSCTESIGACSLRRILE